MNEEILFSLPLQVKGASAGVLEGYASDFSTEPDLAGDVIAAGAFTKSLSDHAARNTRPALLWGHDHKNPIGAWSDVREDSHGLYVKGKLTLTVPQAQQAYDLAKDGALAFSIGFIPVKKSHRNGASVLEQVDLREISLVSMAANPRARITTVKSLSDVNTIREFETLMRDSFGLSSREAKRLSMGGWKAYSPDDISAVAELIQASAFRFRS